MEGGYARVRQRGLKFRQLIDPPFHTCSWQSHGVPSSDFSRETSRPAARDDLLPVLPVPSLRSGQIFPSYSVRCFNANDALTASRDDSIGA
jgi:hypothetical protein